MKKVVSIRYAIFIYFTVSAIIAMLLVGISVYGRLTSQLNAITKQENEMMVDQINRTIDSYLRTVMKLSDAIYYSVIKKADLSEDVIYDDITLLFDNSKDYISNIALFSETGELIESVPAARLKPDIQVTKEIWFQDSLNQTENLHFSTPHVQRVFDNRESQYRWVISLARGVEITRGTTTEKGVLLLDINYVSFEQLLEDGKLGTSGYFYILGTEGEIIFHPNMQLLDLEQILTEQEENYFYKTTVGYTGWNIVGVSSMNDFDLSSMKTKLFIVFIISLFLFLLAITNAVISAKITKPIQRLEQSVHLLEAGKLDTPIYIEGSYEIRRLGSSIGNMAKQMQILMQDIVKEHESKRKSEFDTLQSQINPHFLYNTLDIIVWMIENEQKQEAVRVVTALARFFRISLSKGKSVILLKDEIEHVKNYLMIQQMRFKNKFHYQIEVDPEVLTCKTLKLMLQPLVENAIYHGMEFMDGDGEIRITAKLEEEKLKITVGDNGLGMTEEQVARLLSEEQVVSKKGSGIGVKNVKERIHLYFGEEYGLFIESEPDEGTCISIYLPVQRESL